MTKLSSKSAALFLMAAIAPAPAYASDPVPETTNLTITPSITCPRGFNSETITLSTARGDAIDATFAFCRDPSKPRESWIRNLEKVRNQMMKGAADAVGREAIRRAFDGHIARERAAN